jgi:hypothetical protein
MLKGWRTIAANLLFAAPIILDIAAMPEARQLVPEEWLPYYGLAMALANVVLRSITTTPVGQRR